MAHPTRERRSRRAAALAVAAALALLIAPAATRRRSPGRRQGRRPRSASSEPNGLLGLVKPDAPADVKALVESVNAKRKASGMRPSRRRTERRPRPSHALAGKKAIAKTLPGQLHPERQRSVGEEVARRSSSGRLRSSWISAAPTRSQSEGETGRLDRGERCPSRSRPGEAPTTSGVDVLAHAVGRLLGARHVGDAPPPRFRAGRPV